MGFRTAVFEVAAVIRAEINAVFSVCAADFRISAGLTVFQRRGNVVVFAAVALGMLSRIYDKPYAGQSIGGKQHGECKNNCSGKFVHFKSPYFKLYFILLQKRMVFNKIKSEKKA